MNKLTFVLVIMTFFIAETFAEIVGEHQLSPIINQVNKVDIKRTDNFDDLAPFGEAISDKRIVFIDELTHGEQEGFALKSRIVQYLHQHQGFEVLLLESGLFDVQQIWQNKKTAIKKSAPGNIFYMYASDESFIELFDYIDSKREDNPPLVLAGFDGRLSGELSRQHAVNFIETQSKKFLSHAAVPSTINSSIDLKFDWRFYKRYSQEIIERQSSLTDKNLQDNYIKQSYWLYDQLNNINTLETGYESAQYVARLIHGIIRIAEVMWGSRRHDEHDLPMADNVQWLIDHAYPNKKVIVWGHYIHLNRQGAFQSRYDNLGSLLDKRYADEIYIAHFSGIQGSYREFRDLSVIPLPELTNTEQQQRLETALLPYFNSATNNKDELRDHNSALFIDYKNINSDRAQGMMMFGHEYNALIPVNNWNKHWDGMFMIKHLNPSQ
ncbi:erythromycin esterase family protein [Colwellia asteriadis]|uniref:Erythromycin esterase family protein n=2 Tax=Colwellia asteriadis TaxID=517723 RepID=A0ABN1L4U1_9GAMM